MQSINITKTNTVAFTSPAGTGLAVRMPGELIPPNVALFLFFADSVYNRGMKNEAAFLFLCFSAVLTAGLAGCARAGEVAGAEKVEANYPDVWERVLPEEMRTNIANYDAGDLYPVEKEYTDILDYAVSVAWRLDEAYHIEGEYYDDVVLRFVDWNGAPYSLSGTVAVYYSFFGDQLLSRNGNYKFSTVSTVHDVVPTGRVARRLPFTKDYIDGFIIGDQDYRLDKSIYPRRITLSNDVIYDADIQNYRYRDNTPEPHYPDIKCPEPPKWGISTHGVALKYYWASHKEGVQFLPVGYAEEDIVREDSWLLLQGLDEPRFVTKHCQYLNASLAPIKVYSYYEYSVLRKRNNVVPLLDGTFLFVSTKNILPIFHIVRMQPDMSVPAGLSSRYRWVRYKDYIGILDLYERGELFGSQHKACPVSIASHPNCKQKSEKSCSAGWYMEYYGSYLNSHVLPDPLDKGLVSVMKVCLNLALRDYVRGEFEVYHCGAGDEMVASLAPCNEESIAK